MYTSKTITIELEVLKSANGDFIMKFKDEPGGPIVFAKDEAELHTKFDLAVKVWCIMKSLCTISDSFGKGIFDNTVLRPKHKINNNHLELEAV